MTTHLSDLELDRLRAGERREARAHLESCAQCRARYDFLEEDARAFAARARPLAFADQVATRGRPRRWPLTALMPALAAAALLLLALPRRHPDDGERVKGGPIVELFVRTEVGVAPFAPERHYRPGDALQLILTLGQPLYVAVVDQSGDKVEVLYRSAAPLLAGQRRALDRSFVLDDSATDEQLVALFSQKPFAEDELKRGARGEHEARFVIRRAR